MGNRYAPSAISPLKKGRDSSAIPLSPEEVAALVDRGVALLQSIDAANLELIEIRERLRDHADIVSPEEVVILAGERATARITGPLGPQPLFRNGLRMKHLPDKFKNYAVQQLQLHPNTPQDKIEEMGEAGLLDYVWHKRRVAFRAIEGGDNAEG